MNRNKITFLLFGPTPFCEVVKTLTKRQCKEIIESLQGDEKCVMEQCGSFFEMYAVSVGMTLSEMREAKLKEIRGNIELCRARIEGITSQIRNHRGT
jgi:hypothetical protein